MPNLFRCIDVKNYYNPVILVQVKVDNVRDTFLRHSVDVCQLLLALINME